jgi:hypothetical protein
VIFQSESEKTGSEKKKGEDGQAVAEKKRKRLIVNPEFVQSLDQGDGSRQFDTLDGEQEEEELE